MATKTGSRERSYTWKAKQQSPGNKMENRPRSDNLYHTSRWTKESREFKKSNPLCVLCKQQGKIKASEVTDHVIPFPVHPDFWDKRNWQALCRDCNRDKGNKDKQILNATH